MPNTYGYQSTFSLSPSDDDDDSRSLKDGEHTALPAIPSQPSQPTQVVPPELATNDYGNDDLTVETRDEPNSSRHEWGMLVGKGLPTVHMHPRQMEYTIGKGARADFDLGRHCPTAIASTISHLHATVKWNGYGLPGFGKEEALQASQNRYDEHMSFTITCEGVNGFDVSGQRAKKGESLPLRDGTSIRFAWGAQLHLAGLEQDDLCYYFFSPQNRIPNEPVGKDSFKSMYTLGAALNAGQFGQVHRATEIRTGTEVAVKVITKNLSGMSQTELATLERECGIMRIIEHHRNIVQIHRTFRDTGADKFYIVMDLVEGGELFKRIANSRTGISEPEAAYYMKQIVTGVAFVHDKGVVHRDLKPENILLTRDDPPVLKIVDFGLAKQANMASMLRTSCGTLNYSAPEVILQGPRGYDSRVDAWSIGVILYVMIACQYPWDVDPESQPRWVPHADDIRWELVHDKLSPLGLNFLHRLLVQNPRDRMSVKEALDHPWLSRFRDVYPRAASDVATNYWMTHDDTSSVHLLSSYSSSDEFATETRVFVDDSQPAHLYDSFEVDSQDVNMDSASSDAAHNSCLPTVWYSAGASSFRNFASHDGVDSSVDSSAEITPTSSHHTSSTTEAVTATLSPPSPTSLSPSTDRSPRTPGVFDGQLPGVMDIGTRVKPRGSYKRTADSAFGPDAEAILDNLTTLVDPNSVAKGVPTRRVAKSSSSSSTVTRRTNRNNPHAPGDSLIMTRLRSQKAARIG